MRIKFGNDFGGFLENFGAFDAGFGDGKFAVGAASMKSEGDFTSIIIPIEGVFHFITIVVIATISENLGEGDIDLVFAKKFNN